MRQAFCIRSSLDIPNIVHASSVELESRGREWRERNGYCGLCGYNVCLIDFFNFSLTDSFSSFLFKLNHPKRLFSPPCRSPLFFSLLIKSSNILATIEIARKDVDRFQVAFSRHLN